jgi:hypothetical protein
MDRFVGLPEIVRGRHLLDHGYGAEEALAACQQLTAGTLFLDGVHRADQKGEEHPS